MYRFCLVLLQYYLSFIVTIQMPKKQKKTEYRKRQKSYYDIFNILVLGRHDAELYAAFNPLTPILAQLFISNEELMSVWSGLKKEGLRNTPVTSCLGGSIFSSNTKDLCCRPSSKMAWLLKRNPPGQLVGGMTLPTSLHTPQKIPQSSRAPDSYTLQCLPGFVEPYAGAFIPPSAPEIGLKE